MAENSKIEWCDHTFNPWTGCSKISAGCDNCYAEGWAKRSGHVQWGPASERRRTSESNWRMPLKWDAEAERLGIRYRVFCASLADVFDNKVPAEWRADLFDLIRKTPHLDWLLVTKRIGNAKAMMADALCWGLPNVWIGATITSQAEADRDIPKLLQTPAAVRFLSMEPLLGPVMIDTFLGEYPEDDDGAPYPGRLNWVIVGGESGPGARPMHPQWVRDIRDQCEADGVPFLFKQWGEWVPRSACYHTFEDGKSLADIDPSATRWPCIRLNENGGDGHRLEDEDGGDSAYMQRTGKKAAGRLLDGRHHNGYPTSDTRL